VGARRGVGGGWVGVRGQAGAGWEAVAGWEGCRHGHTLPSTAPQRGPSCPTPAHLLHGVGAWRIQIAHHLAKEALSGGGARRGGKQRLQRLLQQVGVEDREELAVGAGCSGAGVGWGGEGGGGGRVMAASGAEA
jgi:hypothetical protein